MEKEDKKEITMDDLARIVQNGFLKIDERFDNVDKRLDTIEAEINKKVDTITHNTLDYRVEKLEKKFV
jgi:tetrahydromethanopterin S-methyltransferase subunit G